MTSIHTNIAAQSALSTLRGISGSLQTEQGRISSGLRVAGADDNAAYWSISTTMRSDGRALSAVADALAFGTAKVDTAYAGLESVIDVLGDFKAKLVAAREPGVDKGKIQSELDEMKAQVRSIAESASFGGQNWLSTDIAEIYDSETNYTSLVSSFVRDAANNVSVKQMDLHLSDVALFNTTGGGLLEKDPRDMDTIGGMRTKYFYSDGDVFWDPTNNYGLAASIPFTFSGPLEFDNPGDQISFDITVDADDPATGIPGPFNAGQTTANIVINRATVDALFPANNGVISTNTEYAAVLNNVLSGTGTRVYANYDMWDGDRRVHDPERMQIYTTESSGLDGSYVAIANFSSTVGSGGLGNGSDFGTRGSSMVLDFTGFTDFKAGDTDTGVEVSFDFATNRQPAKHYSFDRAYVNTLFGKTNGRVETSGEMVTLLQSLLSADWPDVIIQDTGGQVLMKTDVNVDRLSGTRSAIGFSNIAVSIEPLPELSFETLDVAANPDQVDRFIDYIDAATERVIDGAAKLGALKTRLGMQTNFTSTIMSTIDKGVGRLVDNDMNASSARLKALQTQQQLGVQALNIANTGAEQILRLFQ